MPSARQTYGSLNDMPEALQDFLLSADHGNAELEIAKLHGLQPDQAVEVGDAMMDAVFGDVGLREALDGIKAKLVPGTLVEEKWKQFQSDLIRLHVWPLRDVFGEELTRILIDEGMSTAGWPVFRVLICPLTFSGAATEIATQAGFTFMSPQMRERMRDLVVSRIKGVRIDSQAKEVLIRPSDFGGLGLDSAMADRAIVAMGAIIGKVPIMSEDEYAEYLSEEARARTEADERVLRTASGAASEDDAEIDLIKAKMKDAPKIPPSVLDDAIAKIWESIPNKPSDDYLSKRLRNVISSRLRDVRSQSELAQLLMRDVKVGGMGMDMASAEPVAKKVEEGYADFRTPILEEEKSKIDAQMEDQKRKVGERRAREAEEHARWYQEKVQARQKDEAAQRVMGEQFKHTIDAKEQKRETERFGPMVQATQAGAAPITTSAPSLQARPEVKVSLPTAQIQSQTAPASAPAMMGMAGMRPRMEDIRTGPRLVGLTQELRELTLGEFRRLAKDPQAAAGKIMQKLETLGGESFEKRLAGVQAWQQSPLQEGYLTLVTESFRLGKPVMQLIEEKRKAGIDVPSPEEMSAIISLNGKLHF